MATSTLTDDRDIEQRDALVQRLFEAAIGALDVFSVYIGDRLGLYSALGERGSTTAHELAGAPGTHERYVREWLEQQAATGLLEVEDVQAEANARRFRLPTPYREVFLDRDSLNYLSPLLRLVIGVSKPLPALLRAYREGGGVPYPDYGPDTLEGIADMNRPMFLNQLGTAWLPAVPDVHARLQADPPARVADVGCGSGWSSIAIARAYPNVRVDGLDLDEASIAAARENAETAGLANRVTFSVRDAADPGLAGRYDLVTAFETLHDMARPVEALRAMRSLAKEGGAVVIADDRVGDVFNAPGDEIERLNYGFSVMHCLAVGMAEQPSAGTGTVMRLPTLQGYATQAGFRAVEVLPIEHDYWRFYRLLP